MQLLLQHIEALIFVSEQPITGDEILSCLKTAYGWELKKEQFHSLISELKEKYNAEEYSFELVEIAEGFQFLTKKEYHHAVSVLLQIKAKRRLSTAALETLAIIAYKQPLSKSEIEHIRGVNCDYSIQKLLEKELIVSYPLMSVEHDYSSLSFASFKRYLPFQAVNLSKSYKRSNLPP